jgi:hypothetical protein
MEMSLYTKMPMCDLLYELDDVLERVLSFDFWDARMLFDKLGRAIRRSYTRYNSYYGLFIIKPILKKVSKEKLAYARVEIATFIHYVDRLEPYFTYERDKDDFFRLVYSRFLSCPYWYLTDEWQDMAIELADYSVTSE